MIDYCFSFPNGRDDILFGVDPDRGIVPEPATATHAPWTRLDHEQCGNCPLSPAHVRYCPAAVDLQRVVREFSSTSSIDVVTVRVTTPDRVFLRTCDVQTGLNSLTGLLMASSGCPILARLRSLSRFHLPFATVQETLYRTVGDYLIKQYLLSQQGVAPDFALAGLDALYQDLEKVNACFVKRLTEAAKKDSTLNVICNLRTLSTVIRFNIAEQLQDFRRRMGL